MASTVTIDLRHVARGFDIPPRQIQAVVELLDEGNTVPFITRYRKDQTGGLDEEQIREIQSRLTKERLLAERKQTVLRSIEAQGKLHEKLAKQILSAASMKRLEDLYLPFKPKKQTLATAARARGLEELAQEILDAAPTANDLIARADDFKSDERKVKGAADALLGAGHIMAEGFSERADLRQRLRDILQRTGRIITTQIGGEQETKPEAAAQPSSPQSAAGAGQAHAKPLESQSLAEVPTSLPTGPETAEILLPADPTAVGIPVTEPASAVVPSGDLTLVSPPEPAEEAVQIQGETPPTSELVTPDPATPEAVTSESEAGLTVAESDSTESVVPQGEAISAQSGLQATAGEAGAAPGVAEIASPPPAPSVGRRAKEREKAKAARQAKKEQKKKRMLERRTKAFRDYFDFSDEIRKIPPHRVLAINRGERARVLRVRIEVDLDAMHAALDDLLVPPGHPHADYLRGCARDALSRLILPALERETRRELTDRAEEHAVGVFAKNLRNLLLQPPVHGRRVLAVDPGFKSGCKLAALDQFGNVLGHEVITLVGKPERREEAKQKSLELIRKFELTVVAIGNGTGCRDAEDFFAELIGSELKEQGVAYVIANEAGASVYSTSQIGREEFPEYDASLRGAISIGRRLLDPLSELVKIEPANIGVGLYQHDVKAKHLEASLDDVVESCVNYVGVDVNTASPALLRYVSGLNQLTARRVYEHRREHGPFRSREKLHEVPGIGGATFVQAAGFLKITGGQNPLDATWIHPESYAAAARVLERLGFKPEDLCDRDATGKLAQRIATVELESMAKELEVGTLTLKDILAQLARPGRDPREDLPPPVFKQGVLKLEDLTPGLELTGTVLNVVDFGCFVDIGMHDSGLVHVSRMADRFIRDPHEVVAVGDIIKVWVMEVDKERRRVSLTMLAPGAERHRHGHRDSQPAEGSRRAPAQGEGPPAQQRPPRPGGRGDARGGRPEGRRDEGRPGRSEGRRDQGRGAPAAGGRPPAGGGSRPPAGPGGRPPYNKPRFQDRGPRPTYQPKPQPKPLIPISEEMKAGKAPLRTFGDLMQFFQTKQEPAAQPKSSPPAKKPPAPPREEPPREAPLGEEISVPTDTTSSTPESMPADASQQARVVPEVSPAVKEPAPESQEHSMPAEATRPAREEPETPSPPQDAG